MKRSPTRSGEAKLGPSPDRGRTRSPAAARRLARELRPSALEALASHLPWPSALAGRRSFLVWADNVGALHSARCEPYTLPHQDDRGRPLTIRISVNHLHVPDLEAIARRAGLLDTGEPPRQSSAAPRRERPRFELSCLPHEAVDYAAWVGQFLRAYERGDLSLIPSPPASTYFWNGLTLDCDYAWSQLGWELIERYHSPGSQVPEAPRLATLHEIERMA